MKPVNTNIETIKFHKGELKFSFKHSEMDEYNMDIDVFIGYQETGSQKPHVLVGDAKIKVFMPTTDRFLDMAKNKDSKWVLEMVEKVYDLDNKAFKPNYFEFLEDYPDSSDMEFLTTPFFTFNSISLLPIKLENVLHELLQAFLKQYDFGVIFMCPSVIKVTNNLSNEDINKFMEVLHHYGFESFDEKLEYQFMEYSNTENFMENEAKYYDKNLVMWNWYRQEIVQDAMRDLESLNNE